nr:unnamed protein product [Spirometra erinaceieuropaei]
MHCLKAVLPQPAFSTSAFTYSPLHRQAAKTRIIELMDQHFDLVDYPGTYETRKPIVRKMISLSLAANVTSLFTAFSGVDSERMVTCNRPLTPDQLRWMRSLEERRAKYLLTASQAVRTRSKPEHTVDSIMPSAECLRDPSPPAPLDAATAAEEDFLATIEDLQEFAGCWPLNVGLSWLLNCSLEALTATIPPSFSGEDGRIWATALVLVLLEVKIPWRSDDWRPLAMKGRSWLAKHLPRRKATEGEGEGGGGSGKSNSLDELRSLAKTTLASLISFP